MKPFASPTKSRYAAFPVPAFREGQELEFGDLPVRVSVRPWQRLAWLCFGLSGFITLGVIMIYLENKYWLLERERDLRHFPAVLTGLSIVLLACGVFAWKRVDEVEFRADGINVRRRGLFGTDARSSPISDFVGIRATHRYIEDYEVTSGTTYWYVVLEQSDPALNVSLFSKSRDELADHSSSKPPGDRTDWTERMKEVAKQWSRDLDLPLL